METNSRKFKEIELDLIKKLWNYISTDGDELYSNFISNITDSLNGISLTKCQKTWIDEEVRQLQNQKDFYYKRFKYLENFFDFEQYK